MISRSCKQALGMTGIAFLLILVVAVFQGLRAQTSSALGHCGTVERILSDTVPDSTLALVRYGTSVSIKERIPRELGIDMAPGKSYLVHYKDGELERVTPVPNCTLKTRTLVQLKPVADSTVKPDSAPSPPRP